MLSSSVPYIDCHYGFLEVPASAYEVRGHVPPVSPVPMSLSGADTRRDALSPFGVYTSSICSIAGLPHTKKTRSKSIMIISVRRREREKDGWKGNTKVEYELVTSLCTVRRVLRCIQA